MSIENVTNVRDLVHQEKLLARAELLMSDAPYPYKDRDKVLDFVETYLNKAIEGYSFCHEEASAYSPQNFHLDTLEPMSSSLSALPATLNDKREEVRDRDLYPVFTAALRDILATVTRCKAGEQPSAEEKELAQRFLEVLGSSVSHQTSTELMNNVVGGEYDRVNY